MDCPCYKEIIYVLVLNLKAMFQALVKAREKDRFCIVLEENNNSAVTETL